MIRIDAQGHPLPERTRLRLIIEEQETPMGFDRLVPSPNARWIAGIQETEGGDTVYVFATDSHRRIAYLGPGKFFGWHPDGRRILFYHDWSAPLRLVDVETGAHQVLAQPATRDVSGAALSPDGRWLAYATNTFDLHQIWVARGDGADPRAGAGPGKLCRALGIDKRWTGTDLTTPEIIPC